MPLTATSVELTFDRQLTEAIRSVWNGLTFANIQYQRHPVHALPHLSLAIRDLSGDDPKPAFLALAKRLTQFPVRFDAMGIFLSARGPNYPDDTVVLFLAPKPSEALLEAHRVASEVLHGWNEGRWSHYRRERWVPHCTLAEHLVKDHISAALNVILDRLSGPVTGSVCGLRLINFGAGEVEELISQTLAAPIT
ncbi:MAG: 2'-5' RNA ligase family protein [Alphaproteobacteria bacterium]|nr:2'-5' RNA ligase family protein [Alphaproteobacteria bacterium]